MDGSFFRPHAVTLGELSARIGCELRGDSGRIVDRLDPIEAAGSKALTFLDNPRYARHLRETGAAACICAERYAASSAGNLSLLISEDPYRAFAAAVAIIYPDAVRPGSYATAGDFILEEGAVVEHGARIGAWAEIGRDTLIGANAVIGAGVRIGRGCSVGAGAVIQHALLGDRVIVHPGAAIGQDGFGFALGAAGHHKVPQVGRVIIQDDVEIGANTTIDRGANRDTVIGEGTKIDNQVQIAHNVEIGRHCVIVAQVGIAGSARLGDFVFLGGQVAVNGHIQIGSGAQIAATSGVMRDVDPGARMAGAPAQPSKEWLRNIAVLRNLASGERRSARTRNDEEGE